MKLEKKPKYCDHDYQKTRGDGFLKFFRSITNPERRHEALAKFAHYSHLLPGFGVIDDENLNTVIKFKDKSNSLYLGSPIMLAAGANKFAENIPDFARLGFGGLVAGTATLEGREGNPYRPRVSMIPEDRAINNSMGLNNPGIDLVSERVDRDLIRSHKVGMSVGISVAETPGIADEAERLENILKTFRMAYNSADYVEVNISCPNTGDHRVDSNTSFVEQLSSQIMKIRKSLPVRKAVYAKLSPDMNESQLFSTLDVLQDQGINGLILFNTFPGTRSKFLKLNTPVDQITPVTSDGGLGGLSGRILYTNTFRAVEFIKDKYPDFSIIASGGIDHGAKVWDLMKLGVDAVQSYSVIAYRWNAIHKMRLELLEAMKKGHSTSIREYREKIHGVA